MKQVFRTTAEVRCGLSASVFKPCKGILTRFEYTNLGTRVGRGKNVNTTVPRD